MKNIRYSICLLLLVVLAACSKQTETRELAQSGESDNNQNRFNYPDEEARTFLKEWIDSTGIQKNFPHVEEDQVADDLYAFYSNRNFAPAWNTNSAGELLNLIRDISQEGLSPDDFAHQTLDSLIQQANRDGLGAEAGASLDVLLSGTYLKLAGMVAAGKVKPGDLASSWHIKPESPDTLYTHLQKAVQGNVNATLDDFRPRFAQYEKLKQQLKIYTKIKEEGGWPALEKGKKIAPGDSSLRIAAIRKRLYLTGDLTARPEQWKQPNLYDSAMVGAVQEYQARNGLEVQPAITDEMVEAMNVPVETRLRQIMLNMDRIRWFSSDEMPATYVMVNIPEYQLRVVENGSPIKKMRVVVGKELNSTPIFSDMIEHVEFSPYWNVPNSIAGEELWPAIRKNHSYLTRNHYEILDGWDANAKTVSPGRVNWGKLNNYRIRQKPGPWNALGSVKFMFPNDFAIYLHDTPADHLFDKTHRAYSHGCIRIEEPEWFADWLFPQFTRDQVEQKMNDGEHEVVKLDQKIPVFIVYLTAFEDTDGRMNFRKDIYELDQRLTSEFDSVL